jgi:hypothetical protein
MCPLFSRLLLAFLLITARVAVAEQNVTVVGVDVADRLSGSTSLGAWNTDGNLEGWMGSNTSGLGVTGGVLVGDDSSKSADASISLNALANGPDLDLGFNDYLQIRVKLPAGYTGDVQFEFGTSTRIGFETSRKFVLPSASIPKDGAFHTYRLDLGLEVFWRDNLRDLRVTPIVSDGGHFEIDYIEVGDVAGTAPELDRNTNFLPPLSAATASRMESKHVCVWWDPADTHFTTVHARRALRMCEESFQVYCKKLGYNEPFLDFNSATGPRSKVNFVTWYGGYWAGGHYTNRGYLNVNWTGLGDEGWGNPVPHEFGHVIQMHQPGFLTGGHWESHANYLRAARNLHFFAAIPNAIPAIDNLTGVSNLRLNDGRNLYSDQRYDLSLDDYGTQFGLPQNVLSKVWRDGARERTLIEKLDAALPVGTSVKDVALECCKRWPMLDFVQKDRLRAQHWGNESARAEHFWKQGAQLIPQQDKPGWWRVPLERAPAGWAYQMHDLTASPGATITVELRGLDLAGAGEDWRWCLAAISAGDTVRYSPVWAPGTQSFTLNANETQAFLIVAATPANTALDVYSFSNTKPVDKHADRLRYAYEVRLLNAEPAPHHFQVATPTGYRTHGNGGGIVGPWATVSSAAYVGPNAKVLGEAKVLGAARVEDYAVIQGYAVVQGSAVVSGSALVQGNALVEGQARVRDRAQLEWGAVVRDRAWVGGYSRVDGTTIHDDAIVRGCAWMRGETLSGNAIADHDAVMWWSVSDGVHFNGISWGGWWNDYYSQSLTKPRGLIASYRTEEPDGQIWWDEFGALHAVLRGAPARGPDAAFNSSVMTFDGLDDYAVLDRSLADAPALSFSCWVKPANAMGVEEPLLFLGKSAAAALKLVRNASGNAVLSVSNGETTATLTSTSRLTPGAWHHLAFSLDGGNARLYVGGVQEASAATTLTPLDVLAANGPTAMQANYLGRGWSGSLFKGSFEDVRFYNVPLTATEVRQELTRRGDLLAAFSPVTPADFNGTSTIAQSGARNGRVRTLSAWVKPRASKGGINYEAVFDSGNELAGGDGSGFGLQAGQWMARLDGAGLWSINVSAALGKWQHVALAFNGSTAHFFLNGVRVATRSYTGPVNDSAAQGKCFRVGYSQHTGDTASREFFDGRILNARVHETFLSASQLVLDSDGDGFNDNVEADFASSPIDPQNIPPHFTVAGSVMSSTGEPLAGATVTIADTPGGAGISAVADAAGGFSRALTPGTWYLKAARADINTSAEQKVVVSTANISGIDFILGPKARISGRVIRRSDGSAAAGASVWFSRSVGAADDPVVTATTDADGNFTQAVQDGMWYVAAGGGAFQLSAEKTIIVAGPAPAELNFVLNGFDLPRPAELLFSAVTSNLPAIGNTGDWPTHQPPGQTLAAMGSPATETLNGVRWLDNRYLDGDGFRQGLYSEPVKIHGATIVVAVRPKRNSVGTPWTSIVDLFYNRLTLGIRNSTGQVVGFRNGAFFSSSATIPDGEATILSLVVQPTGQFQVFANGAEILNDTSASDMTSLLPNVAGPFANAFNVGRNNPDGWTTFNGNIGDVFVYGVALTTAERRRIEENLTALFLHPGDSNAFLANLLPSSGSLSPGFASGVTDYTVMVPNATSSLSLVPVAFEPSAKVRINGTPVVSGVASAPVALSVGANTMTTVVTAQDGVTERVYTVRVLRALSPNADLAGLALSSGALSPAFSGGVTQYTASVPHAATSVTVTPATTDATASVRVNGEPVSSGAASSPIALAVGVNQISVVVTARDAATTKTYAVLVTRAPVANDAGLAGLTPAEGALSPVFDVNTTSYRLDYPTPVLSTRLMPVTRQPGQKVTVNGKPVASGKYSADIALPVGESTIQVVVTAPDRVTQRTYAVEVRRPAIVAADLASLKLSAGSLSPAFSADTTQYAVLVPETVTAVKVTAEAAQPRSVITVDGAIVPSGRASGWNELVSGENAIAVVVTAEDGVTTKTYTLQVTRQPGFAGAYDGVAVPVADTPDPGSAVALVGLSVSRTGAFSGKLLLGGRATPVSLRGVMDVSGVARFGSRAATDSLEITTPGGPPLTLAMHMDVQMPFTHQLVGTLSSNSQRVADFVLNRRLYSAAANPVAPRIKVPVGVLDPASDNGRYTAFFKALSPEEQGLEADAYPQGDGWAVFTVGSSGAVSMVGELADGQAFTYTNYLSQDRVLPFYVARPGAGGSASGRITFRDVPGQSDADAVGLRWFKRANPRDAAYPQGWPGGIRVDFLASKMAPPPVTQKTVLGVDPVVAPAANALLSLTGGGAPVDFVNRLAVGLRAVIDQGAPVGGSPAPRLRLTLGADGKIAGQFRGAGPVTQIRGAVFQKTRSGHGYFLAAPAPGATKQSGKMNVVTP